MKQISESELEDLVQRIVKRTMGGEAAVSASSVDDSTLRGQEQCRMNLILLIRRGGSRWEPITEDILLKENLKPFLQEQGYLVDDCGTHSPDSVDYPDFAYAVAKKVSEGEAWRGIIIDGAGIGSCMAANKVPGVRAAMCYDHATALNSREHNNANVLTLGAGMIEATLARQIVITFLNTNFGGGRHARRVDKIMNIERR